MSIRIRHQTIAAAALIGTITTYSLAVTTDHSWMVGAALAIASGLLALATISNTVKAARADREHP